MTNIEEREIPKERHCCFFFFFRRYFSSIIFLGLVLSSHLLRLYFLFTPVMQLDLDFKVKAFSDCAVSREEKPINVKHIREE